MSSFLFIHSFILHLLDQYLLNAYRKLHWLNRIHLLNWKIQITDNPCNTLEKALWWGSCGIGAGQWELTQAWRLPLPTGSDIHIAHKAIWKIKFNYVHTVVNIVPGTYSLMSSFLSINDSEGWLLVSRLSIKVRYLEPPSMSIFILNGARTYSLCFARLFYPAVAAS